MSRAKNNRKWKNALVDSAAQLRLFIPFLVLLLSSSCLLLYIHSLVTHALNVAGSSTDFVAVAALRELSQSVFVATMFGLCLLSSLTLVLWTIYSHRIFGPTVPILRKLKSLCAGQHEPDIQLRRFDEFKAIAESVNFLADTLKSKDLQERNPSNEA